MDPTSDTVRTAVRTHTPSRRLVLRGVFTVGVVAGTAGALAPVLARSPQEADEGAGGRAAGKNADAKPERFAETYRGRDIRGTVTAIVPAGGPGSPARAAHAGAVAALPDVTVHIDGRPLHVMRRADGSYLSTVSHYESFPTLLETARAAVDELGSSQLATVSPHSI